MSQNICAAIPAYNASNSIERIIRGVLKYLPMVMVVDDGSMDDTAKRALDAGAEVITIEKNKGKGYALRLLFQMARDKGYDYVLTLDADGQHDPEDIPLFIEMHKKYPIAIIVGSRMRGKDDIPRARYNSMIIARFFISLAANQFIEDTQCGYRLYPLSILRSIDLKTNKYVTETEILMKAGDMGVRVQCLQVKVLYNGTTSYFRPIMDMTAITAYVISYITVKWTIESVTSYNIFTYSRDCFRDRMSRHKILDIAFQVFTAFTTLPFSLFCLLGYVFLAPFVKNNFSSIRRLGKGFHRITIATHMLPVTLVIAIIERIFSVFGLNIILVDRVLEVSYPDLWQQNKSPL